jgi:hypothetical protein
VESGLYLVGLVGCTPAIKSWETSDIGWGSQEG